MLTTTDADNTPAQLTYTITSGPSHGTLKRSRLATTNFTQADVTAGLITYQHDGRATTSDSFAFTVDDGQGSSSTGTFNITVSQAEIAVPALPQDTVDTTYNLPTGGTVHLVNQGDDLQAVLNSAALGDVVVLQAGATFTGNFVLPDKVGNGWIYIISSELDQLPEDTRVGAADAAHMAKIVTPTRVLRISGRSLGHITIALRAWRSPVPIRRRPTRTSSTTSCCLDTTPL